MAANVLPNLVVLNVPNVNNVYCNDHGSIVAGEGDVFSPLVKLEVERSSGDNKYIHLRFSYNNKYWQKNKDDNSIVAVSTKPEEDATKPSCTLFEPTLLSDNKLYLTHVQTGWRVMMNDSTKAFYVDKNSEGTALGLVNWDTLVKLPTHIALKGDNGKYLKAYDYYGLYVQFGIDDPNEKLSGHEVFLMPDGHVKLHSDYFGMFWRLDNSNQWIHPDNRESSSDTTQLFWPVKIDENTIALRASNGNFCKRQTYDKQADCLAATANTITREARLKVEELVYQRKIYYVRYRIKDSTVYDETPFLAGTARLTNTTDQEDSMAVSITYQDEKSYTFSRGVSLTAGVKTTIKAGLPFIGEGEIEMSCEINGSLEWDTTTTMTTSVTASGTVPVPARTMIVVDYYGTRGTCNIPFSYTQEDRSSTNGAISNFEQIDGIYIGVSYYNFDFSVRSAKAI